MTTEPLPVGLACWVKNSDQNSEEIFLPGKVSNFVSGNCTITLLDGKQLTAKSHDVFPANSVDLVCQDNTMLIHLNEPALLHNVRARYRTQDVYTLTGSILLAINPFEPLNIYSESIMHAYKGLHLGKAQPHVYAVAESAYLMLAKTGNSQSIVVSGESGAGEDRTRRVEVEFIQGSGIKHAIKVMDKYADSKTETNKHLMCYLAFRSKTGGGVDALAEAILQTNPVLEAFGNAKTSRNHNSSRFGKFIKILIEQKGNIVGAKMNQYLLEKSRVVRIAEGERNYHVFYHLVSGSPTALKEELGLTAGPNAFHYLRQSSISELESMPDADMYQELSKALTSLALSGEHQAELMALLAGILHVGNLRFIGDEEAKIENQDCISQVQHTIGCNVESCLTVRSITVAGEKTEVPLNKDKSAHARDALAKAVFTRLFDWLVKAVNQSICGNATAYAETRFIGLLDVFGFEFFHTQNSFEQLAINYANEKLQQFFLVFVFKSEEEEYRQESVPWVPVEYQDNQGCIDLIEKTPNGVFRMLDTQCKTPKATDSTFSIQINRDHRKNSFFLSPRAAGFKLLKEEEAFVVRHFAGNVCYMSSGFMDKNNDTLHPDLEAMLTSSSSTLLKSIFTPDPSSGKKKNSNFNSVARRFINDLDALMTDLQRTHAHFIRCIKPNLKLQPKLFSPALVLGQLRASGTLEAVQLISASYPTRIPYNDIYGRYQCHMPDFVKELEPQFFTEAVALACGIDASDYQLGNTKIFIKAGRGAFLEELKDKDMAEVVPILVEKLKEWERKKGARLMLVKALGGWVFRKKFLKKRAAARRIWNAYETLQVAAKQNRGRSVARVQVHSKHDIRDELAIVRRKYVVKWNAMQIPMEKGNLNKGSLQVDGVLHDEPESLKHPFDPVHADDRGQTMPDPTTKLSPLVNTSTEGVAPHPTLSYSQSAPCRVGSELQSSPTLQRKKTAASLLAAAGSDSGPRSERPPNKVHVDTEFKVTIERDGNGLGIEVDMVNGQAVVGAVALRGAAAKQTALRAGDIIVKVFGFETPTYESAIAGIKGTTGGMIEMTMLRRPISTLLIGHMDLKLGARREWRPIRLELFSHRELKVESLSPPVYSSSIPVRDASRISLSDDPEGGAKMAIVTPSFTYEIRSLKDGQELHRWERKLLQLYPHLVPSIRKEGWLEKKGDSSSMYSKRFCRLDSSYKLHYYKDEKASKELGVIDLSVTYAMADAKQGMGIEITTPGQMWLFKTENKNEQSAWMSSLSAIFNDLKELKREQAASNGFTTLKAGECSLKDYRRYELPDWQNAMWWDLKSAGELVIRDKEGGKEVLMIKLEDVVKVDRCRDRNDWHDWCIDIDIENEQDEDFTITMKPYGRTEMRSWLGILKEQVAIKAKRKGDGMPGSLTVVQAGWAKMSVKERALDRKFAVLVMEEIEVAETATITHTLYWFESEAASKDLSGCSGALDLEEVEAVTVGKSVRLHTDAWLVDLNFENGPTQDDWVLALRRTCINAEGYEPPVNGNAKCLQTETGFKAADVAGMICRDSVKIAVPREEGGTVLIAYVCELHEDGEFRFILEDASLRGDVPDEWFRGRVDIKHAIGVWLLGTGCFRHLDIIMPSRKFILYAEKETTLDRWKKSVLDFMPLKPVHEIMRGWMEKKRDVRPVGVGNSWKSRLFVLLSTRELLYFEDERSTKRRGVIDLKTVQAINFIPNEYYNYEDTFELVTAARRWVLCPNTRKEQQAWLAVLRLMIDEEGCKDTRSKHVSVSSSFLSVSTSFLRRTRSHRSISNKAQGTPQLSVSRGTPTPSSGIGLLKEEVVVKSGWLERREGAGNVNIWQLRFYHLIRNRGSGVVELSLKYFLDEKQTEDEGSEVMNIGPDCQISSTSEPDKWYCFKITAEDGTTQVISASSEPELLEWREAIEREVGCAT